MNHDNLIKGRMYVYWSKSIYENRPSRKFCRLISFNETFARVRRLDLTINSIQSVEIKRLKEVQRKQNGRENHR